jgi:formylglycine-generating enzyme
MCLDGACVECLPDDVQCNDSNNTVQICVAGRWVDKTPCVKETCINGGCTGVCAPDEPIRCIQGKNLQSCNLGKWELYQTCPMGCSGSVCSGECIPGSTRCTGQVLETCNNLALWETTTDCANQNSLCAVDKCIAMPASCLDLPNNCGPFGDESCCAVTAVPGGTFNRVDDPAYPATVSDFWLDRFEVTVGRFRKFVEAYPGNKPAAGAGAHPLIPGSGWQLQWDSELPIDQAGYNTALKCDPATSVWTNTPESNENKPITCVTWYDAFAFCLWDGGRLPTEAEWMYAAAGGSEQRLYPWGATMPDQSYAVYGCLGNGSSQCQIDDILAVGSRSAKGDGKWGQADLVGNVSEWNFDTFDALVVPCENCANISVGLKRVLRGAGWNFAVETLDATKRAYSAANVNGRYKASGFRCARNPM